MAIMPDLFDRCDALVAGSTLRVDRPRGSAHPRFPASIYPLDYGYLEGTRGGDGEGVDVFVGTEANSGVVAVAATVDPGAGDAELKLLLDCSEGEIAAVDTFLSSTLGLGVRMIHRRPLTPLLEFDPAVPAFIEPGEQIAARDVPDACVITFFGDAVGRLLSCGGQVLEENRWEDGPHRLIEIEHEGARVAVLHAGVGAALAGALLEQTIAFGCRAFVVCGGAGSLKSEVTLGHLVVIDSALRDEGTSAHYVPIERIIHADAEARVVVESTLREHGVPFVTGRTWTTDGPYRETPARIAMARSESCLTVDMEASALAAVARFRGVPLAQVVYGGDDLSGESWDDRSWQSRSEVRDNLVRLAASAALRLAELPRRT